MSIHGNLEKINHRIKEALVKSGRIDEVSIVAATKYADVDQIKEAIKCGISIIGENRVKQAIDKFSRLDPVERHMIGHLQTNKVKLATNYFDCIQSVDSIKLAKEINKRTKKIMPVMIEINISGEEQKFGINPIEAEHFFDKLNGLENLDVIGLMAMAPYINPEETRPYFQKIKRINDNLKLQHLSMGMSNDYEVAVEEGSTMVRLGRVLFNNVDDK